MEKYFKLDVMLHKINIKCLTKHVTLVQTFRTTDSLKDVLCMIFTLWLFYSVQGINKNQYSSQEKNNIFKTLEAATLTFNIKIWVVEVFHSRYCAIQKNNNNLSVFELLPFVSINI